MYIIIFNLLNTKISTFYLTNRFQVAVRLFSNRSQMTSKCGKNKKVAHKAQPNRCAATWNLFVLYNKELKYTGKKF